MSVKKNIGKVISICFWLLAGSGVLVLFAAAVNVRSLQTSSGYNIVIKGNHEGNGFIDKNDIINVLTSNKRINLKDKNIRSFDLHLIEDRLEKEVWVKDAELYFDNNRKLQVRITERVPVARIFSTGGGSFYIDSTGKKLPLSAKRSARLPVFTGFPDNSWKKGNMQWRPADEKLVGQIKDLSLFLLNDPFWMAQIAQVDVTQSGSFEMVPTIGNHLIEFGSGEDYEKKFHRLFIFYKQVLAKTGMEKYERIKLQFDRQVIGVKKGNQ